MSTITNENIAAVATDVALVAAIPLVAAFAAAALFPNHRMAAGWAVYLATTALIGASLDRLHSTPTPR